jgi:histidinol-phosphatase
LEDAQVCVTFGPGWAQVGRLEGLIDLVGRARRSRGFGDFWQHMLVAEGAVDLAVDALGVMPYDLAAIVPIVEEAGGTFTDRHGERTYEHDTAISSNGLLHDEAIRRLS